MEKEVDWIEYEGEHLSKMLQYGKMINFGKKNRPTFKLSQ